MMYEAPQPTCTNCGHTRTPHEAKTMTNGFWSLSNYFNISGHFCGKCYDKVSHDSYGNPENPGEYIAILLKQGVTQ